MVQERTLRTSFPPGTEKVVALTSSPREAGRDVSSALLGTAGRRRRGNRTQVIVVREPNS